MEYITKRDMLVLLFETWEEGQGYKENTWDKHAKAVRRVQRETEKTYITLSDTEEVIKKANVGKWYRAHLRQATRRWLEFIEWWEQKDTRDRLKQFLIEQGYSENTVKQYYNELIVASGHRKLTKSEIRNINAALSAFKRFVAQCYRRS